MTFGESLIRNSAGKVALRRAVLAAVMSAMFVALGGASQVARSPESRSPSHAASANLNFIHDFNLAVTDFNQKNFPKAEKEARRALNDAKTAKEKSLAHQILGDSEYAVGRVDLAQSEYQAALAADPTNADAELGIGQSAYAERNLALAESSFQKAIQMAPQRFEGYGLLGAVLQQEGQFAQARRFLQKAVALNPHDWQSRYHLAEMEMRSGQTAHAEATLQQIVTQHPDYVPAKVSLAMLWLGQGKASKAATAAQEILRDHPDEAAGHRLMALVLWKQRAIEASLTECNTALTDQPNDRSMLALQAIELWELNEHRQAQDAFRAAFRLDPNVGTAEEFCRLIACGSADIGPVSAFLHANRPALAPPEQPD